MQSSRQIESALYPRGSSNMHRPKPPWGWIKWILLLRAGLVLARAIFRPGAPGADLAPGAFDFSSGAVSDRHSAIPKYPNQLQVTIDKQYQCAIMVWLIRHDSSVPYDPCSPAARSISLNQTATRVPSAAPPTFRFTLHLSPTKSYRLQGNNIDD